MKDGYNREIDYLRISLTDRCNLRCVYCMPMQGLSFVPERELLTVDELELVVMAAVEVGFHKIRLTGGEPTLRSDIVEIVSRISSIAGVDQLVMTSNGYRLPLLAHKLAEAGLKRVNIHIDSLNPESITDIMRLSSLEKALAGINAAEKAGLTPIKLNAVVTRNYNDEADVVELARLTIKNAWQIRFIELMPLGAFDVVLENYVSSAETKSRIEKALGTLLKINGDRLDGETSVYRLAGSEGTVGFISPVSNPYCDDCNRMRLTADGRIRLCLLADREIDFRNSLRNGGTLSDLIALFKQAVQAKPVGHKLKDGIYPQQRTMSQIGG